mgnify:CR=1 FL=1
MQYTKILETKKDSNQYNIYIIPPYVDLEKTEFKNGFIATGQTLPKDEALKLASHVDNFMKTMIDDAKEITIDETKFKDFANIKKELLEGSWTFPYYDADENGMFCYLRFVPPNMDLEKAGFPHGISLGDKHFLDKKDTIPLKEKIDKIMTESYGKILDIIEEELKQNNSFKL